MKKFNFEDLFILDLANNHQGSVEHGASIIQELGDVVARANVRAAIKFQFRQLDTFIHPSHQVGSTAAHIPRFLETRLSIDDYQKLVELAKEHDMVTMCTPFDEESLEHIARLQFDVIKIASCSLTDYPLLNEVAQAKKPVVMSTGGATTKQIDKVAQLMTDFNVEFALEHCVSIYPTPPDRLQLNQIGILKERYPEIPIGWSTHEDPDDTITVQLACAKGAVLFERHVGLNTETISLNRYSSTPDQIDKWIQAYQSAKERLGSSKRGPATIEETAALKTLSRGVFAKRDISADEVIAREDVFFAMPTQDEGLTVSEWRSGLKAPCAIKQLDQIPNTIKSLESSNCEIVDEIMLQVRGMLNEARIELNRSDKIEISHHYGLNRFREFGAVIIDVINREYCKKLLIQLPRQKHPYHRHERKEETFQVLFGELEVEKNGQPIKLCAGDTFLVEPGAWHKFSTLGGVIFEEISTTHYNDDSFYEDPLIAAMARSDRKTLVTNWKL